MGAAPMGRCVGADDDDDGYGEGRAGGPCASGAGPCGPGGGAGTFRDSFVLGCVASRCVAADVDIRDDASTAAAGAESASYDDDELVRQMQEVLAKSRGGAVPLSALTQAGGAASGEEHKTSQSQRGKEREHRRRSRGPRGRAATEQERKKLYRRSMKKLKKQLDNEANSVKGRIQEVERDFAEQHAYRNHEQRLPVLPLCACGYADDDEDVRGAYQRNPAPVDGILDLDVPARAVLSQNAARSQRPIQQVRR
uniref:Uncharacterized protein n=1 Tax=Phaeomonas parva TaxID=124430 RepID=A0A7S1TS67_9STRA|mmetsp:Transcript_1454/g.3858  ORF Transcript_1454/g.3858 Transcript_1454/m.3858 type:complete len:253 (+) Transcript_1454:94-852(+)